MKCIDEDRQALQHIQNKTTLPHVFLKFKKHHLTQYKIASLMWCFENWDTLFHLFESTWAVIQTYSFFPSHRQPLGFLNKSCHLFSWSYVISQSTKIASNWHLSCFESMQFHFRLPESFPGLTWTKNKQSFGSKGIGYSLS